MHAPRSIRLFTAALTAAGIASAAGAARPAEDDDPDGAVMTAAEMEFEFAGPGDLPGRDPGPRTRPAPWPATPQPAQPAPQPAEPSPARDWFGDKPFWEWSRATGDWAGVRGDLERLGLKFSGSYTLDWSSVWAGGVHNRASTRSLLDLNLTLDTASALALPSGTLFVDFQSSDMRGGEGAGTYMYTSGLETGDNIDQVAEVWYQQIFSQGLVRVKAGKIDAGLEFAYITPAENFVHSSSVYMYTNSLFPTYPNPATGAGAFVYPAENVYAGAGFFDGSLSDGVLTGRLGPSSMFNGDEYLWIAEAGITWNTLASLGLGPGKFGAGRWGHTGVFERTGATLARGTGAGYLTLEPQLLRRENSGPDNGGGLTAFLAAGFADADAQDAQTQVTAGLTLSGTFDGRGDDNAGPLVTWLNLSNDRGYAQNETAFEFMYRLQLTSLASLKPALQYSANPGGDPETDDAVVGVVEFELEF